MVKTGLALMKWGRISTFYRRLPGVGSAKVGSLLVRARALETHYLDAYSSFLFCFLMYNVGHARKTVMVRTF